MQRSDERESGSVAVEEVLDDADGLLDDDLVDDTVVDDESRGGTETEFGETTPPTSGSTDARSRIGVDGRYFSAKALGLAAGALLAGGFLGGLIPLVGNTLGRAAGLFAGAFAVGLLLRERRYVETGLAGAGVGVASALLGVLSAGIFGVHYLGEYGVGLAAIGGVLGLVLALLGHYFGRDLRAGLTRDIE